MGSSPLTRAELEAVLAPLTAARPFPGRAFVDETVFAFERERIFASAWICVGREDEVELPGQWLREEVAGSAVIVARGADLQLRAFFDVCRHRGASVVGRAACGRDVRLECPYHGWTYELDGRLASAPFAPAGFDRGASGLVAVRVEVWGGFVCVTLASGPDLAAWMGEPPPWLATLGPVRRGRRVTWETRANWKLCVENFQESHHFPRVHRALEALTPTSAAHTWAGGGRWLGGTMELAGAETVSTDGRLHGRPRLSPASSVLDAMLFPTLLTSLQPDYLLTYRLVPLAAGATRIVADTYFHAAAFVPGFDAGDVYSLWDRVNAEDRAICEDQQANASSRGFAPACYATVEEGMHAFDKLVAEAHL